MVTAFLWAAAVAAMVWMLVPAIAFALGKGWVRSACVSSYTRIADNVMPPRVKNIANYRNSNLAMAEAKITWRSFWCGEKGHEGDIPAAWNVNGAAAGSPWLPAKSG